MMLAFISANVISARSRRVKACTGSSQELDSYQSISM
jgi:hypothetical protein